MRPNVVINGDEMVRFHNGHLMIENFLSVSTVVEKTNEAFEPGAGVFVNMFGHLVVHEGKVFVAYNATAIGDLCDVAVSLTFIGPTSVPDLVVEDDDATSLAQVVVNLIFIIVPFGCLAHIAYIFAK